MLDEECSKTSWHAFSDQFASISGDCRMHCGPFEMPFGNLHLTSVAVCVCVCVCVCVRACACV